MDRDSARGDSTEVAVSKNIETSRLAEQKSLQARYAQ